MSTLKVKKVNYGQIMWNTFDMLYSNNQSVLISVVY